MLGRKDYTQEELDHAKAAVDQQLAACKKLVRALDGATSDPKVTSAPSRPSNRSSQQRDPRPRPLLRPPVRMVTGKDGNPLNEVELLTESFMNNDGVLRGNNVAKFVPEQSVVKLGFGDRIRLTAAQFERLAKAFFAEIERKVRLELDRVVHRRAPAPGV